jgi:ketosteroid isomerase-like protein
VTTTNERAIEIAYEGFAAADLDRIRNEAFAADMRWTWPGSDKLSGTYDGIDKVLSLFVQLATASDGTFKVAPESIAGVGDFVTVRSSATWTDKAGQHTDPYVQVFRMKNGRASECDIFLNDGAVWDGLG